MATFHISGVALTRHVQDLMLSGRWRLAFQTLQELDGISYNQIVSILEGERTLIDAEGGLDIGEGDKEFQVELEQQRAGWWQKGHAIYKIEGQVTVRNPDFAIDIKTDPYSATPAERKEDFIKQWAKKHSSNPDRAIVTVHEGRYIIWLPVEDAPLWYKALKDLDAAYAQYLKVRGKSIPELGYTEAQLAAECRAMRLQSNNPSQHARTEVDPDREYNLDGIRSRVLEQNGDEWITLYCKSGRQIQVPSRPFSAWALQNEKDCPDWSAISPSGMKLAGDSSAHSDWVLGAGLTLDEAYEDEIRDAAYEQVYHLVESGLAYTPPGETVCVVFSGKGKVRGKVTHGKPNTPAEPGATVIIPTGAAEYHLAALTIGDGVIVMETGGRLCHLATVAREQSIRLVMCPNALDLFLPGLEIEVDLDRKTIKPIKN